jgi:hypothetical protein
MIHGTHFSQILMLILVNIVNTSPICVLGNPQNWNTYQNGTSFLQTLIFALRIC